MGKIIEEVAMERGHEISVRINSAEDEQWERLSPSNTDAAIEFSTPSAVLDNIQKCFRMDIPLVVGTTGWYDRLDEMRKDVEEKNLSFLWASNFSIGVNLFFELNRQLARLMSGQEQYRAEMEEIHHVHKLDAPSGTAISLANDLISQHFHYKKWVKGESSEAGNLGIISKRIDEVPGTHQIRYSSDIDEIVIRHEAHSRKGFALGAVLAAEWLQGRRGFFDMGDVLNVNLR